MAEDDGVSNSLIHLDGEAIGKMGQALINRIAEGVGGIYAPLGIVRKAKADAKAAKIKATTDADLADLQMRTADRIMAEEMRRQAIIEEISGLALAHLKETATPDEVEIDWIANFFEKSRSTSDNDMQILWAKILAEEANAPGSFSRRAVNVMADLGKHEAEMFAQILGRSLKFGSNYIPLVFNMQDQEIGAKGLHFGTFRHLESLGLISINFITSYSMQNQSAAFLAYYGDKPVSLIKVGADRASRGHELPVGQVLLTPVGDELAKVATPAAVDDIVASVAPSFLARGWDVHWSTPDEA